MVFLPNVQCAQIAICDVALSMFFVAPTSMANGPASPGKTLPKSKGKGNAVAGVPVGKAISGTTAKAASKAASRVAREFRRAIYDNGAGRNARKENDT